MAATPEWKYLPTPCVIARYILAVTFTEQYLRYICHDIVDTLNITQNSKHYLIQRSAQLGMIDFYGHTKVLGD